MRRFFTFTALLFVGTLTSAAQSTVTFTSLQDLLSYADNHSSAIKNNAQRDLLARYQTVAAKLAMFNLKGDAVLSSLENTKLPVNFLPAEIFNGPAGTFRRVTLGQRYVSSGTLAPQIDILSPYAAAKVKMAKANERLTSLDNLISKRDLYQSLAGNYYNILSYRWQIEATHLILDNADSIVRIITNKQETGLARPQDVSSAIANSLTLKDKLQQLEAELAQQVSALRIFCDIDPEDSVVIALVEKPVTSFNPELTSEDQLFSRRVLANETYLREMLHADKKWLYPTLTAYGSLSWQQYSNERLYGSSTWYPVNYVGLRVTLPLLPDANKLAAVRYDRVNLRTAEINTRHAALQDSINNKQAVVDYRKAFRSYQYASQISVLKEDIYRKNLNIYNEGILSTTDLFISFNDWLNSSLNEQALLASSEYVKAKIMITHFLK